MGAFVTVKWQRSIDEGAEQWKLSPAYDLTPPPRLSAQIAGPCHGMRRPGPLRKREEYSFPARTFSIGKGRVGRFSVTHAIRLVIDTTLFGPTVFPKTKLK